MLDNFLRKNWAPADRRAWLFSLLLMLPAAALFSICRLRGFLWTIRTGIEYIPKEIQVQAFKIPSDLVEFSIGIPHYVFAEYINLQQVLPPGWLFPVGLIIFLAAFSLLSAGISYLEGSWFYASLAAVAASVALFEPGLLNPMGFTGSWVSGAFVILTLLPVYTLSEWLASWNLARRWWVLLLYFALISLLFFHGNFTIAASSEVFSGLYFPLLIASMLFLLMASADVLHGLVVLLTRAQGNRQSLLHFSVFSIAYLSTFILTYLKNTGRFELDIFYPDPFFLQILILLTGLWLLPEKAGLGDGQEGFLKGFASVYAALAVLFMLASSMAFGTGNDLMVEVLEDAITLLNFCLGLCFFLYVLINFSDLMLLGLRVHEVLFRPRYFPVAAVGIFGLAGVMFFLFNNEYFPFYQAMAGKYVVQGDQARLEGKPVLAGELYRQALGMESRNQRANISLAMLYMESGQYDKAFASAEASMEKKPFPEAVMVLAQVYRLRKKSLDEILCLQDGMRKFPDDGRLMNNAGVAFASTIYPDSASFYLSKASLSQNAADVAGANLVFLKLWKGKTGEGSVQTMPEITGDWAALNNQMVYANQSNTTAGRLAEMLRVFPSAPEEIRPYLLYHSMLNEAINRDTVLFSELAALEDDSIRKYYSEAIMLASALVKYRTGHVYEGMEKIIRLFEASTGNRRDFGLLLGQLYYEQGAYQTAADYFRQAAVSGLPNAWYWYAIAVLDAGKASEAAIAFRESMPFLSQQERVRVSILADGLGKIAFSDAAKRSDLEKSAFLKTSWNSLKPAQVKDLIYLVSDKESKMLLWKYCFNRSYQDGNASLCRDLFLFAENFHGKDKKWAGLLEELRPDLLGTQGKLADIQNLSIEKPKYYQALLAEKEGNIPEALQLFRSAIRESPFDSRKVVISVEKLEKLGSKDEAYQQALDLTSLNPGSAEYLKLYALISMRMGLPEFAFQCLPKYETLTSAVAADALRKQLTAILEIKNMPVPSVPLP